MSGWCLQWHSTGCACMRLITLNPHNQFDVKLIKANRNEKGNVASAWSDVIEWRLCTVGLRFIVHIESTRYLHYAFYRWAPSERCYRIVNKIKGIYAINEMLCAGVCVCVKGARRRKSTQFDDALFDSAFLRIRANYELIKSTMYMST